MTRYQQPEDLQLSKELLQLAPKEAEAFLHLKAMAEREDGIIAGKTRELISIAVALTTQCPYCIDAHTRNAAKAGATREEIAEVTFITAALQAGSAVGHGLLALRLFDQALAEGGHGKTQSHGLHTDADPK
jgi:AhpD family alkylhydroperoxidase